MRKAIVRVVKWMFVVIGIEFLLFLLMIFFVMTDESISTACDWIHNLFKYVAGFPLVLINEDYPFFLEYNKMPISMIPLTLLNVLIQVSMLLGLRFLLHKVKYKA